LLADIQNTLKRSFADVKWVEPQNIHLTLKFLGERDKKKITEIIKAMDGLFMNTPAFYVELSSLGAFPKKEFPRVIWVGLSEGEPQVKEIAEWLDGSIAKLGIPKETRAFSSHITLGRVRSPLNRKQLVEQLNYLEGNFPERKPKCLVQKITLFQSTLTPQGPIYAALHEVNLKTN
jgi:2'-5' RNA ligase